MKFIVEILQDGVPIQEARLQPDVFGLGAMRRLEKTHKRLHPLRSVRWTCPSNGNVVTLDNKDAVIRRTDGTFTQVRWNGRSWVVEYHN